ncbi:probable polyamine transporter At3g13620 [Juglans microcarpa x Juglans regia]|uniref:probable polyamine transporter At3g13620 n=1 Tax=Juglans microcarpa x Juglans regia TaxID=2249226 RepID=UPI001B7ED7CF|nr:probable polyamine transporter At3g13620 [Juglans microcarpa x Juglans regia]
METRLSSPDAQPLLEQQEPSSKSPKKLALIPLVFLIYFEVAGGPYGEESAVGAAGPLFSILGFLIFPFVWSIPEAVVTAELATTFPGNGGYVIWANHAFGPFWGSLMGSWKFFSGVINLASYPVLCVDYLKLVLPIFSSGLPRYFAVVVSTLVLSFFNYTGLTIVGYTAVTLGVVSLLPFIVMSLVAIPKIDPSRWISLGQEGVKKDWTLFFNTLFWNLNFWDNASTLAGEVEQPQKTYPKALFSAGLLTCLAYLIPLLAATGSIPLHQEDWVDGYFADAAEIIAGKWLKVWIEIGAVLSVIGLYEAQLSSCAYQLLGMADLAFLPQIFGARSTWFRTPWVGIFLSTLIALAVSFMSFVNIISSVNFLYSLGMLLEFSSFLWLRRKLPVVKRPFKVPMGLPGLVVMCLIPSGFLVYVMAVATSTVFLVSALLTLAGLAWYFFMEFCKSRLWLEFNNAGEKIEDEDLEGIRNQ